MRYLAAFAAACVLSHTALAEEPLRDLPAFLREVRSRLQTDAQRQYGYAYLEHQRRISLDKNGRPSEMSTTVIDSRPGFPGEARWERAIVRDGRPVPDEELRREEQKHRQQIESYRRRMTRQTDADRARQEQEWEKRRRELSETLDDIFRVYEIRIVARDVVDGHATIVFSLVPRPGVKPVSEDGQWFRHFKGRAWISETDYELVRLEVEALDDVTVGMGLLARIYEGTRASFERRKLADGAWLPAKAMYTMSARVLLLKQVRREIVSEYSDYRRSASAGSDIISP